MFEDDSTRLADMFRFAEEATQIAGALSKEEFLADRIRGLAATRCIEVVGEAAISFLKK
jgi:uncharacterized protein with HEPN domain